MSVQLSQSQLEDLFNRSDEATLVLEDEHFVNANQAALDLIGVSSIKIFKSLHPAMISPEYQPDGESSKNKADKIFSALKEKGYDRFNWQHITLKGQPFDVEVTLRLRKEDNRYLIDVHWRVLEQKYSK